MNTSTGSTTSGSDTIFLACAYIVIGLLFGVWLTAQLAALLFSWTWINVDIEETVQAAFALPGTITDPVQAWPVDVRGHLPGPVGFVVAAVLARIL